jgi:hypothetical protein
MSTVTINKPHLLTKLEIWSPRYSDKYSGTGEWTVLISKSKVYHASSLMLVYFSKAKHLKGQRFCITRDRVQRCPSTTNGKIPCFAVPMSMLDSWDTYQEVNDIAMSIWSEE